MFFVADPCAKVTCSKPKVCRVISGVAACVCQNTCSARATQEIASEPEVSDDEDAWVFETLERRQERYWAPDNYSPGTGPVCGSDGTIYPSICRMMVAACKKDMVVTQVKPFLCGSASIPPTSLSTTLRPPATTTTTISSYGDYSVPEVYWQGTTTYAPPSLTAHPPGLVLDGYQVDGTPFPSTVVPYEISSDQQGFFADSTIDRHLCKYFPYMLKKFELFIQFNIFIHYCSSHLSKMISCVVSRSN